MTEPSPVRFNILIPGQFDKGPTNRLVQFYPGETQRLAENFDFPNYPKYGIGQDIAMYALAKNAGIGVLMINLRGADAAYANVILSVKHKVLKDVPKLNAEGAPLYLTPAGVETTEATGNTAIVRDVLSAKFVKSTVTSVNDAAELEAAIDALYSDTADTDGYKTIPLFGMMYKGASVYGNNLYFRILDAPSSIDKNIYYKTELFNGSKTILSEQYMSLFSEDSYKGESIFVEKIMNETFGDVKTLTSIHYDKFIDLLKSFIVDVDPRTVNIFNPETYYYDVDATSLDVTAAKAFVLENGNDGTKTLEDNLKDLFGYNIIPDLKSIIRHRINYIPDLEYSADVLTAIETFVKDRNRTSIMTAMRGTTTFESAITERNTNHYTNAPNVRQIATCQSGIAFNDYTRKNHRMPASYFDTKAIIDTIAKNGHPYAAFAGADVRWMDFVEDSVVMPKEDADLFTKLSNARINIVKMDKNPGAYLHEQNMNTELYSDQTELNNAFIIADMVYDIADLIHENNYKFNDLSDVNKFQEKVKLDLNPKYEIHSTSMTVTVAKAATSGPLKDMIIIQIKINFKDLAKEAKVQFILTDDL